MSSWVLVETRSQRKRKARRTALMIGKDMWMIIFTELLEHQDRDIHNIGCFKMNVSELRSVCRSFSTWISPLYCLGLIYKNPLADSSLIIVHEALNSQERFYCVRNSYYRCQELFLSKKWRWSRSGYCRFVSDPPTIAESSMVMHRPCDCEPQTSGYCYHCDNAFRPTTYYENNYFR